MHALDCNILQKKAQNLYLIERKGVCHKGIPVDRKTGLVNQATARIAREYMQLSVMWVVKFRCHSTAVVCKL